MNDSTAEPIPGHSPLRVLASPARKNKANNPYNSLLYDAMPAEVQTFEFATTPFDLQQWDIFHIHWPDLLLRHDKITRVHIRAWKLLRKIRSIQKRGGKVVWTAHNMEPHKMPLRHLALSLWRKILRSLDGVIYLNRQGREQLEALYPFLAQKPSAIIPHGHYIDAYPPCDTDPYQHLGIQPDKPNLLFFGKIRLHKGLSALLDAFNELEPGRANLIVAGQPGKEERLCTEDNPSFKRDNIKSLFRHIEDGEVSGLFQVADAVILPYLSILNSGTAILALSMRRPVVAPRIGSLPTLQQTYGENWIYLYDPPLDRNVIESVLTWLQSREDTALDLSPLDWEPIAQQTAAFYRQLLDTSADNTGKTPPAQAAVATGDNSTMKKNIKKILQNCLPGITAHYRAYQSLLLRRQSYLRLVGWLDSIRKGYPCDTDGSPLPWMNYAIIEVFKDRINKQQTVFEYGSGYSTLFFAERAKSIVAVEYDQYWFEHLNRKIPDNAELIYQPNDVDGDYCRTILRKPDKYDIVIVDGRDRVNCVKQAVQKLSDRGVILLDDSHRHEYAEGLRYAKSQGFKTLDFTGLKPLWHKPGRTTLIYRSDNCFDI
ncbi:glycosyltransferase [Exilibacterium tricleocarpae]|uniref:Glycosyltransferase n=1 Tax=Exilibacterium tricleocarpae TaxID=2591008 RepID=A0A545TKD2_9GAMM|nr:glycosyltransferase [Exilibacterium tricleocarpae]TQV77646.1 glycosyltransferase [Exilibacterium tricleocarpae]